METTYTKKDKNTITVVEVVPEKIIPAETLPKKDYDLAFLKKQAMDIQIQWDEQLEQKQKEIGEINIQRQKELDFVDNLISEAELLGIVVKVEPVVEPLKEPTPLEGVIK